MPGVSSRADVPGAKGIGKVKLRFRHIDETKKSKIGAVLFLSCFAMIVFAYAWTFPFIRFGIEIPTLQRMNAVLQRIRLGQRLTRIESSAILFDGSIVHVNADHYEIKADNIRDAVYMQGYLHAHQRFFEMDYARRVALGYLSEFYGESTVSQDSFAKALGLEQRAINDFSKVSAEERLYLESYANGVNAHISRLTLFSYPVEYITQCGLRLFLDSKTCEIKPWRPIDTLALARLDALQQNVGWKLDLTRFLLRNLVNDSAIDEIVKVQENVAANVTADDVHHPTLGGSQWAGKAGKGTFLAANFYTSTENPLPPFLTVTMQSRDLNVTGFSRPGLPFVQSGHNHDIAWGATVSAVDNADLILESSRSRTMISNDHNIIVTPVCLFWQSSSCAPEVRTISTLESSRGPVISDHLQPLQLLLYHQRIERMKLPGNSDTKLVLYSTTLLNEISVLPWLRINQARDWETFSNAAAGLRAYPLNLVYADQKGGVQYTLTGASLPRPKEVSGTEPYSGLSIDELPQVDGIAGQCAFEADSDTCHASPQVTIKANGLLVLDDALSQDLIVSNLHRLQMTDNVSIASITELHRNTYSPSAVILRDLIMSIDADAPVHHAGHGTHQFADEPSKLLIRRAQVLLSGFDGYLDNGLQSSGHHASRGVDSAPVAAAATIIEAVRLELVKALLRPAMVSDAYTLLQGAQGGYWFVENDSIRLPHDFWKGCFGRGMNDDSPSFWLTSAGGYDAVLRQSIVRAMRFCEDNFGSMNEGSSPVNIESISYSRGRLSVWIMSKIIQPMLGSAKVMQTGFVHHWDWARVHTYLQWAKLDIALVPKVFLSRGPFPTPGGIDSEFRSSVQTFLEPNKVQESIFSTYGSYSSHRMTMVSKDNWSTSSFQQMMTSSPRWVPNHCNTNFLCSVYRIWLNQDRDVIEWLTGFRSAAVEELSEARIDFKARV